MFFSFEVHRNFSYCFPLKIKTTHSTCILNFHRAFRYIFCLHYENTPIQIYRKFHLQKNENFQIKTPIFFQISAQNIDYGYGGSNEYPQSMFSSKNKENNVYPCKPQFYFINVRFKGVKIT